ncbi:MAG: hypothetical protein FWG85_01395 [Bacteroidetes bacterium]|nr:hypothetical protein [Bacteroidota bacterium]
MSNLLVQFARILKLAAISIIALVGLAACGDGGNPNEPKPPIEFKNIEHIHIECDYLDSIFSIKNQLIPVNYEIDKNIYIINSKEELNEINPFYFDVDCIDFSKYTLIGGYVTTHNNGLELFTSFNEGAINYFLDITYTMGPSRVFNCLYFWRLYPKLKTDKNITINTTGYQTE